MSLPLKYDCFILDNLMKSKITQRKITVSLTKAINFAIMARHLIDTLKELDIKSKYSYVE